jgi:hypothetical protein
MYEFCMMWSCCPLVLLQVPVLLLCWLLVCLASAHSTCQTLSTHPADDALLQVLALLLCWLLVCMASA